MHWNEYSVDDGCYPVGCNSWGSVSFVCRGTSTSDSRLRPVCFQSSASRSRHWNDRGDNDRDATKDKETQKRVNYEPLQTDAAAGTCTQLDTVFTLLLVLMRWQWEHRGRRATLVGTWPLFSNPFPGSSDTKPIQDRGSSHNGKNVDHKVEMECH